MLDGCEEPGVGRLAESYCDFRLLNIGALTPALCKLGFPLAAAALVLEGVRGDCGSRQGTKDSPWGSSDDS